MAGDDEDDSSRRGPLIAMGMVVLLVVVGWFITRALHNSTRLEDCLMSGRTNCAPVETQGHRLFPRLYQRGNRECPIGTVALP